MLIALLFDVLGVSTSSINTLITQYGYIAIFIMLVLEAASLPLPSEIVLPAVGYLAATGSINVFLGFAAVILGGIVGMGIDYYIAYFLEKELVYEHLGRFHIKRARLVAFESWFEKNGAFVVFVARLLPVVRGFINFPAGFARMDIKKFYAYSIPGNIIWAVLMIGFGYYALTIDNIRVLGLTVFAFFIVLYLIYRAAIKMIR